MFKDIVVFYGLGYLPLISGQFRPKICKLSVMYVCMYVRMYVHSPFKQLLDEQDCALAEPRCLRRLTML